MSREELIVLVGAQAERIAELEAVNEDLAAGWPGWSICCPGIRGTPPVRGQGRRAGQAAATGTAQTRWRAETQSGQAVRCAGLSPAWTDDPDERIDRFPHGRCECHDLTAATDLGVVDRYQQHEIPQLAVRVTRYDRHSVRCGCGRVRARPGPVGYGPDLQAFVVYLMVVHFIPADRCVALLQSLTGAAPSVGFVHGLLARAVRAARPGASEDPH